MASTEQRDKLKEYLLKQQQRRSRMDSPEYQDSVGRSASAAAEGESKNALAAALMSGAAQFGAIGGKVADASPVKAFADSQAKTNAGYRDRMAAEDDAREKRYGVDARVYEYLADKEQRSEETAAEATRHTEKMKQDREIAEGKLKLDQSKDSADRALKARELDLKEKAITSRAVETKAEFAKLPPEAQTEIKTLANKNANKKSIANQMRGYLAEYQNAQSKDEKLRIGGMMIKTLNSPEGADAVGAEEAKRLAGALEFQKFNMTGAGPMFGRDLKGFNNQVVATIDAVESGIKMNQSRIDELYGRPTVGAIAQPNMERQGKGTSGQAIADEFEFVTMKNAQTGEVLQVPKDDVAEAELDGFKAE